MEGCVGGVVGGGDEQSKGEEFGDGSEREVGVVGGGRRGVGSNVKEEGGKEKISNGESAEKEERGSKEKVSGAGIEGSRRGEGGRGGSEKRGIDVCGSKEGSEGTEGERRNEGEKEKVGG